ncbi:MAG: Hsp20/alpha crystallin family protein [Planctomycetota bacterium]|nr:MAG: Hsp20/alpha crystallin family protein [Planctomycetota bacterium]
MNERKFDRYALDRPSLPSARGLWSFGFDLDRWLADLERELWGGPLWSELELPEGWREDADGYTLDLRLPEGFGARDVEVSEHEGVVTVRGRHQEREGFWQRIKRAFRRAPAERREAYFESQVALPELADPATLAAHWVDGGLRLRVAKPEHARPRRIRVEAR